ncbi:UDP-4-amino-4,6-dideoxy-N-acetyl-beta-L-altrosamine N-acetyltransferase [Saliterribacillus persicus]|uniref:UDP-4-amino-4, 6-dideoxy-N-acetyl-beta-L-altrosamine N-acetyltransferase n=1 Tax=Saliterribacillus persicus TaxID=930114 RepID=A0A368YD44_9BACI|nr:UDP-4-amino-4,6-dideoxy-N-acetyl-beta-L-altrosamine N-acetyltransferase [Saliterribacillus persicus]RCW77358.1 UDP-4-amino-4,6-dideoxy-N-acetyl-beta-L-altrosamine N-acetyltransferase [Saliterribacillus persicus]
MNMESYLRPVTKDDLEIILTWRNKPEIRNLMFNDREIEWENHLKWFESLTNKETDVIKLFVESNEPRGVVQLNKIDKLHGTAEWGFYIGDAYRKGLGTLLAYHALNYIFDELKIRKLSAQVLDLNEKSLEFHRKLGFKQEGILQEQIWRNDRYIDVFLFAQFNYHWNQNKSRLAEGYMNG